MSDWLAEAGVLAVIVAVVAYARYRRGQGVTDAGKEEEVQPIRIELSTSIEGPYKPTHERDPKNPDLPAYDAWETDMLLGTAGEIPVRVDAQIRYTDGDGQTSVRRITTRTLVPWNSGHAILAHCHGRQAHRTFRTDRISEFVDLSTGEVVPDPVPYLLRVYDNSPHGRVKGVLDRHTDELCILLFVGRANGSLSPKERSILLGYLQSSNEDVSAPAEVWREAIPDGSPTVNEFRRSLKVAAAFDPERKGRLVAAVRTMAPKGTNELTRAAAETALSTLRPQ